MVFRVIPRPDSSTFCANSHIIPRKNVISIMICPFKSTPHHGIGLKNTEYINIRIKELKNWGTREAA